MNNTTTVTNTKKCFFISFGIMADSAMVKEFEEIKEKMPGIIVKEGKKKKGYYVYPDPVYNTGFDSPYQMLMRKYGCYYKGTVGLVFREWNKKLDGKEVEVDNVDGFSAVMA